MAAELALHLITFRSINTITFPVYIIGSDNWEEQDGLLFLDNKLLDDKNMPGKTLGIRRLQSPFKDLYPLKSSLGNLLGILKQTKNTFIDNEGIPFIYEKTESCSLRYYKIRKVERKESSSVLWLKDISFPFKIPRPPSGELTWAGVLHKNNIPWMIYEHSEHKKADTRRKA